MYKKYKYIREIIGRDNHFCIHEKRNKNGKGNKKPFKF